jgi:hypothetical protein
MNLTNVYELPEALMRAIRNDPYTGGGDISVTKLIDAPKPRVLRKKYGASVVEDVADFVPALLGQGVHAVLERAGDAEHVKVEERLFAQVRGWTVSGAYDRHDLVGTAEGTTLDDYKVTSTYAVAGKIEWERQLNCLRWLAVENGYTVDRLRIIAILKDWKKSKAKRDPSYPQAPVVVVPVPVWDLDEAARYIEERVALHQQADSGEVPPCTDEERWYSGTTWALTKPGAKRAIRIYQSKDEIDEIPDGSIVEERRGVYRRCDDYCSVAAFCDQNQTGESLPHPGWELGNGD